MCMEYAVGRVLNQLGGSEISILFYILALEYCQYPDPGSRILYRSTAGCWIHAVLQIIAKI